jgi:hypothetical protein
MKKALVFIAVLIGLTGVVFAQEAPSIRFSVGGGAYFDTGILVQDYLDGAKIGVGGYGFFDFTYAEVDVGFGYYRLTDAETYGAALNAGFLLKYPFIFENFWIFPKNFTVSPVFGVRFSMPVTGSDSNFDIKDSMRLGLQGGFNLDFPLNNRLYLRTSALCNFDFFAPGENPGNDTLYAVGPMVRVGIGYKF